MSESRLSPRVIDYPSSDGKPMTESEAQFIPLTYAALALREHFKQRDDVYVGANMFLYYEENNPRAVVAPDVFVVIGTPKHVRDSYLLWNEPKGPDLVVEVTSRSTRREDQGRKKGVYASLGVSEYFLFDPTGDYLRPRLQGMVLRQGTLRTLAGGATAERRAEPRERNSRASPAGSGRRTTAVRPGQRLRPVVLLRMGQGARTGGSRTQSRRGSRRDGGSRAESRRGPYRRVGDAPTKSAGVTRRQTALWFHRRTERANTVRSTSGRVGTADRKS